MLPQILSSRRLRRPVSGFLGVLVASGSLIATVGLTPASAASPTGASLYAWGNDEFGQLGDISGLAPFDSPEVSPLATGVTPTAVSAGNGFSLAIGSDHSLYAQGYLGPNQLPHLFTLAPGVTPTAISAGDDFSLAIGSDGRLYAWGYDQFSQLGDDFAQEYQPTPKAIILAPGVTPIAISAGSDFSLAIGSDGRLYAWGADYAGQIGNGDITEYQPIPEAVTLAPGVTPVAISAGNDFSLAIGSDGNLYAWGYDMSGQLGNDMMTSSQPSPEVIGLAPDVTATAISAGGEFSLAIGSDGNLYAWGDNGNDELGDANTDLYQLTPEQITLAPGVLPTAISAGDYDSLAIGSDGNLYAWGWNIFGEVGDGTTTERDSPEVITLATDVTPTAISAGSGFSLAIGSTTLAAPTVSSLSPSSGPNGGGTVVTIDGSGFSGASAVHFGANAATSFSVVSSSQITASSPAGSLGSVDVTVTSPGGTSATSNADAFTYLAAPTVSSLSPSSGPNGGGTVVTIDGSGFSGASAVHFGANAATSFSVVSSSQITASSPAGSLGSVDVTVTSPGGTSATSNADAFTYLAAPTVSSLSPSSGPNGGGTVVTIDGSGFSGASAVHFGANAATSFSVVSSSQITASSPAGSLGSVDVTVTSPGGTSATSNADAFTYLAAPTVSSLSPSSGPNGGGTVVTIDGSGFSGASAVHFGANAATSFSVVSSSQITASSPAGSLGSVDVTVTSPGGTSATSNADAFTYLAAPTVSSLSPSSGPNGGGTVVTIDGNNLEDVIAVHFGTTLAKIDSDSSASQLEVTAPKGSGSVDVTVTTPVGLSAKSTADRFTYLAAPTVSSLSPSSGPNGGGTVVTIDGSGFSGASAVHFGANAATSFSVVSSSQITASSPAGSLGSVDVTVTSPGGTSAKSASDRFTYLGVPTVSSLSPSSGPNGGGTLVAIEGNNLEDVTAVHFGSTPAMIDSHSSASQIEVTAPKGSGSVYVTVTTPGGTSAKSTADRFNYLAGPTVTKVSPATGPSTGGGIVTIRGNNLEDVTAVHFGTELARIHDDISASEIKVTAPKGSGSVYVTVTTPGGTSARTKADRFRY